MPHTEVQLMVLDSASVLTGLVWEKLFLQYRLTVKTMSNRFLLFNGLYLISFALTQFPQKITAL